MTAPPKEYIITEELASQIDDLVFPKDISVELRSRPYTPTTSAEATGAEQVLDRLEKWVLSQIKFDEKTGRALWSPDIRNEELLDKIAELRQQERERG